MHQLAVSEAGDERGDRRMHGLNAPENFGGRSHVDVVLGEVDAGFEQCDQLDQLILHRPQPPRYRSFGLLRGDARLVQRCSFDQIAHGFGLRQIDAAVQVRPEGEFARLGQPCSGLAGALQRIPQHGRRAMARNLDNVLGGVGSRGGEEGRDHMVDGVAFGIGKLRQRGGPGFPAVFRGQTQKDFGDGARVAPGNAHDADATTPGRRGDSRDRVFQTQGLDPFRWGGSPDPRATPGRVMRRVTKPAGGPVADEGVRPTAFYRRGPRSRPPPRGGPPRPPRPPRNPPRPLSLGRSSSGRGRGGRIGSGSVFKSAGTITTWRIGPSPTLSLRTSVSARMARCRIRRSRLFMGLKWNGMWVFFTRSAAAWALIRNSWMRSMRWSLASKHTRECSSGAIRSDSMLNCSRANSSSALLARRRSTSGPENLTTRSGFS